MRDEQAVARPEACHVWKEFKHARPFVSCALDPRGRYVVAGAEDDSVQRFDLASGAATTLAAHESWVFGLAFTPDGQHLLTGGCDGQVKWWSIGEESPAPTRSIAAHAGWVRGVAVSPNGALLATCGNDRLVKLWSVVDGAPVLTMPGHERLVYSVAFHPSGESLVSADLQGRLIEWDLATGKERRRIDAGKLYAYNGGQGVDYGGVRDLSFSADGAWLACSGLVDAENPLGAVSVPACCLVDWAAGAEKFLQRPKGDWKGVGWGDRFHRDGFHVMLGGGSSGGVLLFYRPDSAEEFFRFGLPSLARDLDLSADGLTLATAHHDGHVRLVRMAEKLG